jgi:thiol-disulfide isomerase/thioredoxin
MSNFRQKVEVFANIAIVIVCIVIAAAFIDRYFLSASPASQSTLPGPRKPEAGLLKTGSKIAAVDLDWGQSSKTLVLAVSETCHFCKESIPFYQKLSQLRSSRKDIRFVGVMPQSDEESQSYFKDQNIPVDAVKSMELSDIHVQGTPTLILVDENGTIVESWVGKLPPKGEEEVVSRVFGEAGSLKN